MGCRKLSESEVSQVLSVLKTSRDQSLFILGIKTGFRISELLSLKVKDVMQNGEILDRVTVHKNNMKGKARSRSVILHPEAKALLKKYLNEVGYGPERDLFVSHKTKEALSRIQAYKILKQAYLDAGLTEDKGTLATHSMRKTFANKVYENLGRDILKTGKALGHVGGYMYKNTELYLEVNQDEVDGAILA